MSGHSNHHHHLPNNSERESNKRQRVAAAVEEEEEETAEDEVEQIAERLHIVQRRCPTQTTNVLLRGGDALQRWCEEAASVTKELQRFILRNEPQQQLLQREEESSDSKTNNEGAYKNIDETNDVEEDIDDNTSWMWKVRLDFYESCFLLKCNHQKSIRKKLITGSGHAGEVFPDGCLRYLGNALLHNTHITELVIDVDSIFEEPRHHEYYFTRATAAILQFIRTSTTLEKVGITYAMEYTTDSNELNCQFAAEILNAITTNNASIKELSIVGVYPVDAFHTLMSSTSTTTLKTLCIDCSDFDVIDNHDHRNQLLRSLSMNRSIDHLSLKVFQDDDGWEWFKEIPRRMGSGPANVRTLTLERCSELPPAFYKLMKTTTTLQTLEMHCRFSREHRKRLHRAFAKNQSIENLKLIGDDNGDDTNIDSILRHLHHGPSTLRKLALKSLVSIPSAAFEALRKYLCRTTAIQLENLELEECIISNKARMTDLMAGLQELDSRQSSALVVTTTQLTLKSCRLGVGAMNKLVELVVARSGNYHRNQQQQEVSTTSSSSWLWYDKDPNLVAAMNSPPEIKVDQDNIRGNVIGVSLSTTTLLSSSPASSSSAMIPTAAPYHSTQFVSISTYPYRNAPAYCDSLMAAVESTSSSIVWCVQLSHLGPRDISKLALCLPRLISLCALHLINLQPEVVPATILKGLQQNRSLLTTSFLTEGQRPFFENRRDRIVAQSYCQRNRVLLDMILRKKKVLFNLGPVDAEPTTVEDNSCSTDNDRLVLLPKLFRVAVSIPLMKSQFLLAALLELDVTIGPHDGRDSL